MTLLGGGDSAITLVKLKIQEAVEQWQMAPDEKKSALAEIVFMHAGSILGMKLADFIKDKELFKQIKADFDSADK